MLVSGTTRMLSLAQKGHYAIGAFNVENMEFVQAVVEAAEETKSPVIIATSVNTLKYATPETFYGLVKTIADSVSVPVAIHLDHGQSCESVMKAIKGGYKSVMFDGSKLPYIDNVNETRRIVDICSYLDVSVEGELGAIGGKAGDPRAEDLMYTDPKTAVDFVKRTGVNSLAVAIGTTHGIYKATPKLDYSRLKIIRDTTELPLVLHGASGLSDEQIKKCIENGICKVNIATELRIAWTNTLKTALSEKPHDFDPKVAALEAKKKLKELIVNKMYILGCVGKNA